MNKLPQPSSETKLAMLRFMKKHALPRMIEAEKKNKSAS
jgi:hypothetical protein